MYIKKHNVKTLAIILLLFLINHLNATTTNGLTITATNSGESLTGETDYTYTNGVLTVKTTTPVTIDGNSTSTTDRIVVATGMTATITINNVVIDVSSTENACAFDIQGNASVTLILAGTNTLKSGKNCAGLHCETTTDTDILTDTQNTASLLIKGTGKLTVTGGENGAGIGGNKRNTTGGHGGIITIEGGEVEVTTGSNGAGIGGANGASGGRITIKGGKVKATGGWGGAGAGIGSGNYYRSSGGIITIEGGEVEAIPGTQAAGIGGGYCGSGGTITISGGTVKASGGSGAAAIGHGAFGGNSTFTTTSKDGKPGNAFILSLKDIEGINSNPLSGVIFQGSGSSSVCSGKIYGTPTLKTNATIPSNTSSSVVTLEIENGKTLVIDEGVTLTNGGKITNNGIIAVKGTFTNNGTYEGSGVIYTLGIGSIDGTSSSTISSTAGVLITFDKNAGDDAVENMPALQVMAKSSAVTEPTERPTRNGYTFMGWGDNASSKTPITDWTTQIDADKTYYAIWKYTSSIAFKNIANNGYSYTYGETAPTVEATVTQSGSTTASVAITYYIDADCQTKTSSSDNSGATGDGLAPKNAGTYYVKASYDGDDDNTAATTIATYTIKQKELTVSVSGAVEKVYDGTTTATLPTFTLDGVVSGETVTLVTTGYSLAYSSEGAGESISLTATGQLSLTGDAAANYSLKQLENLTGKITAKELTVTITPGHYFKNETFAYTLSGVVSGEELSLAQTSLTFNDDGTLQTTIDDLSLANSTSAPASNYTLKTLVATGVTGSSKTLADAYAAEAQRLNGTVNADWKTSPTASVTLTPSTDYTIREVKASIFLQGTDDWKSSITIDYDCKEFHYELKYADRTTTSGNKTITINLDKTAPEITLTASGKVVTVALSDATSGLASCKYTWDNGVETDAFVTAGATSHSFTLTGDAAKKYLLKVVATDAAGNTTTKEQEFDFSDPVVPPIDPPVIPPIDPTPPVDPDEPVDPDDPDVPVANEKVDCGTCRIYASGSTLCIDTPSALDAWIVTADGRLLRRQPLARGANRVYGLRKGIYIIRLSDGTTQKVRVGNG